MGQPGTAAAPKNGSSSVFALRNYKYAYRTRREIHVVQAIPAGHATPTFPVGSLNGGGTVNPNRSQGRETDPGCLGEGTFLGDVLVALFPAPVINIGGHG